VRPDLSIAAFRILAEAAIFFARFSPRLAMEKWDSAPLTCAA
jgi:hypothetical protein